MCCNYMVHDQIGGLALHVSISWPHLLLTYCTAHLDTHVQHCQQNVHWYTGNSTYIHKRPGPNWQCRPALMKTTSPILLERHSLSQSHTMLGQRRCSKGWSLTCRHLWWQRCRVHCACQLFNLPIPARTTTPPHAITVEERKAQCDTMKQPPFNILLHAPYQPTSAVRIYVFLSRDGNHLGSCVMLACDLSRTTKTLG